MAERSRTASRALSCPRDADLGHAIDSLDVASCESPRLDAEVSAGARAGSAAAPSCMCVGSTRLTSRAGRLTIRRAGAHVARSTSRWPILSASAPFTTWICSSRRRALIPSARDRAHCRVGSRLGRGLAGSSMSARVLRLVDVGTGSGCASRHLGDGSLRTWRRSGQ